MTQDEVEALTARSEEAWELFDADRVDDAIGVWEALLPDLKQVLGIAHPETLGAHNELVGCLCSVSRHDAAIAVLDALIADQIEELGADDVHVLESRHRTVEVLRSAGRFDAAITTLEALIADMKRIFDAGGHVVHQDDLYTPEDYVVLGQDTVLGNQDALAELLRDAGRYEEAIAALEALINDQEQVHGPESRESLASRQRLGRFLAEADRTDEALSTLEALLDDQRRLLGTECFEAAETSRILTDIRRAARVPVTRQGTPENWLHYWKFQSASGVDVLQHAASDDFIDRGVAVGDSIYVISYRDGEFFLIGSAVVGKFASAAGIRRELGYEPYTGSDHIIFEPPVEARLDRVIPLEILEKLQFETQQGRTSVTLGPDGIPSPQAFRTLRNLTSGSAWDLDQLL